MRYINGRLTYTDPKMTDVVTASRKRLAKRQIREGAVGLVGVFAGAFYGLIAIIFLGLILQLATGNLI